MSRFGLRSHSDGLKLSEEKANNKKLCKSAKVALKRVYQKKKKSPLLNNDIESKESTPQKTEVSVEKNPAASIMCSLPLHRLRGFVGKLNITNKLKSNTKLVDNNEDELKREQYSENDMDEDDDEEKRDTNYQKPQTQIIKILCLYCDKKFTSHKMQLKHVETVHTQHRDRRCSGRNSQMHHDSKKKKQNANPSNVSMLQNFPGCTFCKKTKVQQISAPAKDLNGLFLHLTECHADKYFGCKMCVLRFQNTTKLSKHVQIVHKNQPFGIDESSKSKDNDTDSMSDKLIAGERVKNVSKMRMLKTQKISHNTTNTNSTTLTQTTTPISSNTIIGAEEPILSRLGLTQNRLPNNRKGVRLRRDSIIPDVLLKTDQSPSSKIRNKTVKSVPFANDTDVVFRVPTRTDLLSSVFDDDFYREVIPNVRTNLLFHLDGKIDGNVGSASIESTAIVKQSLSNVRNMLVERPVVFGNATDSEIHAATSLSATTAFPTLLTAEQYGGDTPSSKIRRPHTKHSWKWKWDSVKKFKLINEGGKIVKKMKQPMLGLRDLSKLDMWTQLTMRQKHENQQQRAVSELQCPCKESLREEKQRLNEQLNFILDMRLLPHIILEQNEQAIIKLENDEFGITPRSNDEDGTDSIIGQTFSDENFLSLLQLLPHNKLHHSQAKSLLSGEWERPRCYLCMCCEAKFEKLKSLAEHKMFRHSHIFSTHYEVVGRELLAGNLLRHLFIPKRALSCYNNESNNAAIAPRKFQWSRNYTSHLVRGSINIAAEEESSDSIQSILNLCNNHAYCKNSTTTTTDDCDTDTKTTLDINTVSPSHSMQSSSSSFATPMVKMKMKGKASGCTKCSRKCNGVLDLYRHLLDCSGDYIWSLVKKRKYRYYCGSKRRRPCNKHNFVELRKSKQKCAKTSQHSTNDMDDCGSSFSKTKTPPRPRPSDAESIKKMLENLPAKRVCKKIFPTVTKKTRKSKKSKLINKHKMFNKQVLRTTRSRQISQAAKLLSKNKNKFPNKMTSKKTLKIRKHCNLNLETVKQNMPMTSPAANSPTINSTNNKSSTNVPQVENCPSPKHEDRDVEVNKSKPSRIVIEMPTSPKNSITTIDTDRMDVAPPLYEKEINDTVVPMRNSLRSNKGEQLIEEQNSLASSVQTNSDVKTVSPILENFSCNKKRSKKINDCIAMLTGKLEEKLKTEQKVGASNEICADAESIATSPSKKKTPKRKTISRRIIKLDDLNTSKSPTTQTNEIVLVAPAVPLSAKEPAIEHSPPRSSNMLRAVTKVPIPVPCPSLPSPEVTLTMLPKVPLFLPVEKFRPMATIVAPPPPPTSLPLPMPIKNLQATVTSVPIALLHPLPPPFQQPVATSPHFSIEPLNLSSSKHLQKQTTSQDLTCQIAHRAGIPMRRQTICGFEARNFLGIDEMEPLDLSKKSKKEPLLPKAVVEVATIASLAPPPMPPPLVSSEPTKAPVISPVAIVLQQDAALNKQFYSNLDLLKIPQVRNPVYVPTNDIPNLNPPKCAVKKRNNSKSVTVDLPIKPIIVNNTAKAQVKESLTHKRENFAKNKPTQKMDEEVINHIDDAINSVVNAVKASLPDDENDKLDDQKVLLISKAPSEVVAVEGFHNTVKFNKIVIHETTTEKVFKALSPAPASAPAPAPAPALAPATAPAPVPLKHLTPVKRCMRSKTLDCRPAALNCHLLANNIQQNHDLSLSPHSNIESVRVVPIENKVVEKVSTENVQQVSLLQVSIGEQAEQFDIPEKISACTETRNVDRNSAIVVNTVDVETPAKFVETETIINKTISLPLSISSHETNINSVSEENISNINNTSSGFHSSGQSEIVTELKKKQRRRRKNELAAIVADQLLESFKIDKARRDNLKKLENLAYEKSEDLLLTGMLLMSSTKRNAASSSFQVDKGLDKNTDSTKRQKPDSTKTLKNKSKVVESTAKDEKDKSVEKDDKDTCFMLEKEKEIDVKKSKRRQYRRRGKALDNENITKLKSSLESFSIGIEKQLSEMEAKNSNALSVAETKSRSSVTTAPAKSSVILRPSILSATLEQPNTSNKNQAADSKTAISSRDPRLNKNIHKGGKDDDDMDEAVPTRSRLRSADAKNLDDICDFEEDNYLTEIAKNVNEKIMAAENEDFVFANDGFEMVNELQDDSNSKYYRPQTSMSVRSAPNFNDDQSNFDSICDENTNTEVMDMDLDDELSVYTSYSQDVGRGRGRRRRRRRSILLKRRPKKRSSRDLSAEKFECELCKKTFFTVNSLAKHNMTLLHVSKVSAQEYLMSKSMQSAIEEHKSCPIPISQQHSPIKPAKNISEAVVLDTSNAIEAPRAIRAIRADINLANECQSNPVDVIKEKNSFNVTSRLTLNPDERLFYECCNILKGAETPRINNEDCNNANATFTYSYQEKIPCMNVTSLKSSKNYISSPKKLPAPEPPGFKNLPPAQTIQHSVFRDPQSIPSSFNKMYTMNSTNDRNLLSPTYTAVSQFSAVTNTTSRFKTKAAMKGYENINLDLTVQQELETKSRTVCKLTELAEIALGNEKPNSPEFTPITSNHQDDSNIKRLNTRDFISSSVNDNHKDCNMYLNVDRPKNNETQSSTSSKTIMHSSIIKAAVEEHNKTPSSKIIIPDRPFKNIGLEEKETITFQKPKTTVNLLTDDNNSVSTASYSDRDDFDFGSISCDDDSSIKTTNERIVKNNSSDSSSSRATAKTLENKSLIMGRIFKHASTKTKCAAVKVKSVGVQKDQAPKADLNQLFDELRGDNPAKTKSSDATIRKEFNSSIAEGVKDKHIAAAPELRTTRKSKEIRKKSNASRKSHKDISKLQSELGMSPEEIEKLIDEGQRKSKRRCATNRPKKLVEMWSSDEYEEFLSTKDIIALIEENEKKESKRKRKNSVNQSNASDNKERDLADPTPHVVEGKRKNVRSLSISERKNKITTHSTKQEQHNEREKEKVSKANEKREKSITPANSVEGKVKYTRNSSTVESAIKTKSSISKVNHNNSTSNRLKNKKNINTGTDIAPVAAAATAKAKARSSKIITTDNDDSKNPKSDEEIQDCRKGVHTLQKEAGCLTDTKRNNHRTRNNKERKYSVHSREDVNNFKAFCKEPDTTQVSKKRNINNNNSNNNNNNTRTYKSKRKTQQNQSPPRRKRLASEKLYYWSSSSDEDFGRINTSNAQDFESGEQYQKHGWIVGDSHKKLVTLLAIAKGNKKVENCGVKKNICKKKS